MAPPATAPAGPAAEPGGARAYLDYVHVEELLGLLRPRTGVPAERHFLAATQIMEILFALVADGWRTARDALDRDDPLAATAALHLADEPWRALDGAWALVAELDPEQFHAFRPALGSASGFHSFGYRLLELLAGHRDAAALTAYRGVGTLERELLTEAARPDLHAATVAHLRRRGIAPPVWPAAYAGGDPSAVALADALARAGERMDAWRRRHLGATRRTLGGTAGTAGSAGADWLAEQAARATFPELSAARSEHAAAQPGRSSPRDD